MTYELLSNQDWIVKGYVFIKAFEKDAIVNPLVEWKSKRYAESRILGIKV